MKTTHLILDLDDTLIDSSIGVVEAGRVRALLPDYVIDQLPELIQILDNGTSR